MKNIIILNVCLLMFLSFSILAQKQYSNKTFKYPKWKDVAFCPLAKGNFEIKHLEYYNPDNVYFPESQVALLTEKLSKLIEFNQQRNEYSQPQGLDVEFNEGCKVETNFENNTYQLIGVNEFQFYPLIEKTDNDGNKKIEADKINHSAIILAFNYIKSLNNDGAVAMNIYTQPVETGKFMVYPCYRVYEDIESSCIFYPLQKQLWKQVTVEEFAQALIQKIDFGINMGKTEYTSTDEVSNQEAYNLFMQEKEQRKKEREAMYQMLLQEDKQKAEKYKLDAEKAEAEMEKIYKSLAQQNNQNISNTSPLLKELEDEKALIQKELSSMNPASKNQLAYYKFPKQGVENKGLLSKLSNKADKNARPLVKLSEEVYDPKKPESEVQFIVARFYALSGNQEAKEGYDLASFTVHQMKKDEQFWKEVIKLLNN